MERMSSDNNIGSVIKKLKEEVIALAFPASADELRYPIRRFGTWQYQTHRKQLNRRDLLRGMIVV
jgi:hypothetical protein